MKNMLRTEGKKPGEDERRLRDILQRMPAAVYTCDRNGYITFFNKAAATLWGREPEPGIDRWCGSWKTYRPNGTTLPPDECPMALTLKEGRPVNGHEIIIERPDGERRIIMPYPEPLFDVAGKMTGALNTLVDITGQKEIKGLLEKAIRERTEELRESEDRYHGMIAEVQDYAILLLDIHGNIQNWNKGAEKIKGYSAAEITGKNFRVFYTPADQQSRLPETLLAEARNQGKANHEGWRVKKDGSLFWSNVVITALHDKSNRLIGFSKVTRDLTERKINEDELREKSRLLEEKTRQLEKMNQELTSFVYISSHDLQEPLRKIQTFASYILHFEKDRLSEKGKDFFTRLDTTAARMKTLIHDLLVYSRTNVTNAHLEPMPLDVFLLGAKEELAEHIEEKKACIESDPLPQLPVIPFQFQQLFTNILGNSLKYARKNIPPHIVIKAGIVPGSAIAHRTAPTGARYHHISFSDNGIGFDPVNNQKIFEIFNRLHSKEEYDGTGIGLAICKKIAENHQGFITAEGKPQQGALIHLYIPVAV